MESHTLRGVICYYSSTGNTRLACQYLSSRVGVDFELVDVIAVSQVDLAPYDVVGLAAPTDFGGMPKLYETFLANLPQQDGKPAFVLNTFGFGSGLTLRDLDEQATARGFTIVGGHSLRTPENYPPMIAIGLGSPDQPKPKIMRGFDAFIGELAATFDGLAAEAAIPSRVRLGFVGSLTPRRERTKAREDMGEKFVDTELCTQCGTCAKGCPYGAIELNPTPVFDLDQCYGCWRCFNRCPQLAIYTAKFRGKHHYPTPSPRMAEALGA
jgi:ferredoxin